MDQKTFEDLQERVAILEAKFAEEEQRRRDARIAARFHEEEEKEAAVQWTNWDFRG